MNIEEAKNHKSDINVKGRIEDKGEARTVNTKYGETQVCDSYLVDYTDRIKLTLWGENIEKVENGDTVCVQGAYTTTFRNEVQLNVPKKNGKLEIISSDGDCGDDNIVSKRADGGDGRPIIDDYGEKKVKKINEDKPGWWDGSGGSGGIANKDRGKR